MYILVLRGVLPPSLLARPWTPAAPPRRTETLPPQSPPPKSSGGFGSEETPTGDMARVSFLFVFFGCFWLFLVVFGCFWLFLVVFGCFGCFWLFW